MIRDELKDLLCRWMVKYDHEIRKTFCEFEAENELTIQELLAIELCGPGVVNANIIPSRSTMSTIETISSGRIWDMDKRDYVYKRDADVMSKLFKSVVDIDHPDIIFFIPRVGYWNDHPFRMDEEIKIAFTKEILHYIHDYTPKTRHKVDFNSSTMSTLLTDVFQMVGNVDELYAQLRKYNPFQDMSKFIKTLFFDEKKERGESLIPYLKMMPPSSPMWREIPITLEFLNSLSPVKRLKFLCTVEANVECTYEEIKRLVFPLYDNAKHKQRLDEVLVKYKMNYRERLVEELLKDSDKFNYCMSKFNNFFMSEIVDFFKQNDKLDTEDMIRQFVNFILKESSPMSAKAFMDGVRFKIEKESKHAKKGGS